MKLSLKFIPLFLLIFNQFVVYSQDAETLKKGLEEINSGNYIDAVQTFNQAIDSYGVNPKAEGYYLRGTAKFKLKDFQGAIGDFTKAIDLKNSYYEAFIWRGQSYAQKNNDLMAIADFNEAIRINPVEYTSYFSRGISKKKVGNYRGAISDFTKTIELNEEFSAAYALRGETKSTLEDYAGSLEDFQKASQLSPKRASYLSGRALAKLNLKDYKAAILDFKDALKIENDHAKNWYYLGYALSQLGKYTTENGEDGAITCFNKSIELEPNNPESYYGRGFVKAKQGDKAGSIADFTLAANFNEAPKGKIIYSIDMTELKLAEWRKTIQENYEMQIFKENFYEIYFQRGATKIALGDFKGAIDDLTLSLEYQPMNAPGYLLRAIARSEKGLQYEAIHDCETAILLNNKMHQAYFLKGIIELALKKEDGCSTLSKAGELGNPKAYEVIKDYCN